MTYNHIFSSALPDIQKFSGFGFVPQGKGDSVFVCRKNLGAEGFYAELSVDVSKKELCAQVFDGASGEKYALFDVPSAHGAFVGELRAQVQGIVDEFCEKCFTVSDVHKKYVKFLEKKFSAHADFPWEDTPEFSVFRCPNKKWFALIMRITYKQLGFPLTSPGAENDVWVVNLKADSEIIPQLTDKKTIFPAYHMNKKYWITVLLTAATDYALLCRLTEQSFSLVCGKK